MLRPFLLVGVGGSGGKTLRAMRQTLLRRIRQVGWTGDDLPVGWQMLWIDSVSVQVADGFNAPLLNGADYCGLVPSGASWEALTSSLTSSVAPAERMGATSGWVAESVPIDITKGAGQSRAIGRVISAAKLNRMMPALKSHHDKLVGPTVEAELADLSTKFGLQSGAMEGPVALVISSVAGGSGAGMFLDVVEALRSVDPTYNEPGRIVTILYTPDVFSSVGMTKGVPANTLGALAEVVTGVWSEGVSAPTEAVYKAQGLQQRARHGFGSKCNFLVGASNANVSLGSQEDVYQAVGESLSALVADDRIQDNLVQFTVTNVFLKTGNAEVVDDRSGLRNNQDDDQSMPFSALGMGRVNVGADRFRQYIAGVVSRDIVESLLWPAFAKKDPANPKPDEQLIDERVAQAWDTFRNSSGLDERDPANQVIDALVDPGAQAQRLSAWALKGVSAARGGVEGKGLPAEEWRQRFISYYTNFLPSLRADEDAQRYALAQVWAASIQERLEALLAESVLRYGYPVTLDLLGKLIDEMQFVVDELKAQASSHRTSAQQIESRIMQTLNVGRARLAGDDPAITTVGQLMQKGAEIEVLADRCELAARLIEDVRLQLLIPLKEGVETGYARLMQSVHQATMLDGRKNPWPVQPRYGEPVPTWLLPGGTERVLIQPKDYEAILGTQTRNALQDVNDKSLWQQILRTRVALGRALGSNEPLGRSFLTRAGSWTPQDLRACATGVTGQQAAIAFPQSFEDFTGLVDTWLGEVRLSSDVGAFLRQGLKAYVESGTPQEQVQRQNDFIAALTAAVNIAAPFVKVKSSVVSALHPNLSADSRDVLVSTIPFPPGHPLHDPIREVFRNGKLLTPRSESRADSWFATAKVDDISVFTMSGEAMLPMAFDNLMVPIAQSWAQANPSLNSRLSFWALRRARPLVECIPVGPQQLQAMVRGWFTGRLLGQIKRDHERDTGWRVQIWNPDPPYNGFQPCPYPLLSATKVEALDVLPAVLQSLLIAMIDVHTKGNLGPLVPYQRLIDIGENGRSMLEDWIADGTLPQGAETPEPPIAGTVSDDPETRRSNIHRALHASRQEYEELFKKTEHANNPYTVPLAWELRDQIRVALDDLTAATNVATTTTATL
jgi:hypothetical protein